VRRRASVGLGGVFALSLAVSGCVTPGETGDLTIFGPYTGVEADVFGRVLESFERETGITTSYVGSADFQADFDERVASANLPDILVLPQPGLLARLVEAGRATPLSADASRFVVDAIGPVWADALASDGAVVGIPYRFVLKSLVWYRADVFAERGYTVPTTLDDLAALEQRMIDDGQTPWCAGMDDSRATGWWATDWIEDLVLRRAGADTYRAWGRLETPFTDAAIESAMAEFQQRMLAPGAVDGGARSILNISVQDAIAPMFEEPPGCLMHKQASFQSLWLPPGVSIDDRRLDIFAMPPAAEGPSPLVVSGELVASTTDDPAAERFLRYLLDDGAFEPWLDIGGNLAARASPNPDADPGPLDGRLIDIISASDTIVFDASDMMIPEVGTGSFFRAMSDLLAGRSASDVAQQIQETVPSPAPSSSPR
jgi:alpha-glucoside transport system substrate-binding protein